MAKIKREEEKVIGSQVKLRTKNFRIYVTKRNGKVIEVSIYSGNSARTVIKVSQHENPEKYVRELVDVLNQTLLEMRKEN